MVVVRSTNMAEGYTTISNCRSCGGSKLTDVLSLGTQYVSDFVEAEQVHLGCRCPIELVLCNRCGLVQQLHTAKIPATYWYRSGTNETMKRQLRDVTQAIEQRVELLPGDVVLDIGSN